MPEDTKLQHIMVRIWRFNGWRACTCPPEGTNAPIEPARDHDSSVQYLVVHLFNLKRYIHQLASYHHHHQLFPSRPWRASAVRGPQGVSTVTCMFGLSSGVK